MLDKLLSKWGRRIAFALMAVGAVYAVAAAIAQTGPARPVIAWQARTIGAYSLKVTACVLLLPAVVAGYAVGFLFDLATRQGAFGFHLPRKIRIIGVPPGEAPEAVRKAWVGLELPLAAGETTARSARTVGVISGAKSRLDHVTHGVEDTAVTRRGYVVDAHGALEVLALHEPDAAAWWEQNAPHAVRRGRKLMFAAHVCREI